MDTLLARQRASCDREVPRPAVQVAVTTCRRCRRDFVGAAGEQIEIARPTAERLKCDAEDIGDLESDAPTRVRPTIPAAIRRKVFHRDNFAWRSTWLSGNPEPGRSSRCPSQGWRQAFDVRDRRAVQRASPAASSGPSRDHRCAAPDLTSSGRPDDDVETCDDQSPMGLQRTHPPDDRGDPRSG